MFRELSTLYFREREQHKHRYWIMRFGCFPWEKTGTGVSAWRHISTSFTVLWTNNQKSQNTASTCVEGAQGQQGSREGTGERSLCNDDVIIQPMMIMAAKTTTSICRSGHSATSLPLYITINQLAQLPPSLIYFLSWLWWGAFPNHLNVYGLCLDLSRLYFTQAISQYIIICMKSWFYEFYHYHKDINY